MGLDSEKNKRDERPKRITLIIIRELFSAVLYVTTFALLTFYSFIAFTNSAPVAGNYRGAINLASAAVNCAMLAGLAIGAVVMKTPAGMSVGILLGSACPCGAIALILGEDLSTMPRADFMMTAFFILASFTGAVICAVGLARYIKERRAKRAQDAEAQEQQLLAK